MTVQSPVPLRPDERALARMERRSLVRAITAMTLASRPTAAPADNFIKAWNDPVAERVLRRRSTAPGLQTSRKQARPVNDRLLG
jgi:hypothetical protein